MINIENDLIKAQITYMEKEILMIKDMYFTHSEYDYDYCKIIQGYEEKLKEKEYTLQEQLEIYKSCFIECLQLLFDTTDEDIQEDEVEYIATDIKNYDFDEENPF